MPVQVRAVARLVCQVFEGLLLGTIVVWVFSAPVIWILRDGLGPDSVQTSGARAASKFLVGWGVPALVLLVPLVGLYLIERRLARQPRTGTVE